MSVSTFLADMNVATSANQCTEQIENTQCSITCDIGWSGTDTDYVISIKKNTFNF